MIEPAPPYRGEGPRALWHVSEDATIERFEPHLRPEHAADEPLVWAIDTRHLPLYWFPRDCPRASFWANSATVDEDVERFLGGDRSRRVHVIESEWLDRMRETPVFAYRMPEESFDDLLARHADARIELRIAPELLGLWENVITSTLDFSGIRLRNATLVQ